MYTRDMVTISKADDGGYVVGISIIKKKSKESKGEIACDMHDEKTLLAKDMEGLKGILDKALSNMKPGGMEEDEFASAFKEAMKED